MQWCSVLLACEAGGCQFSFYIHNPTVRSVKIAAWYEALADISDDLYFMLQQ